MSLLLLIVKCLYSPETSRQTVGFYDVIFYSRGTSGTRSMPSWFYDVIFLFQRNRVHAFNGFVLLWRHILFQRNWWHAFNAFMVLWRHFSVSEEPGARVQWLRAFMTSYFIPEKLVARVQCLHGFMTSFFCFRSTGGTRSMKVLGEPCFFGKNCRKIGVNTSGPESITRWHKWCHRFMLLFVFICSNQKAVFVEHREYLFKTLLWHHHYLLSR